MVLSLIIVAAFLAMFLFVFFSSDAPAEYLRLIKLNKYFPCLLIDDYFNQRLNAPLVIENTYIEFIASKYWDRYFLIRAFLCPVCLTPILFSIISSILFLEWYMFPAVYVFGLLMYFSLKKLSN